MEDLQRAESKIKRQMNMARRKRLFDIINLILSNEIENDPIQMSKVFNQSPPRLEFVPLKERGLHSNYMKSEEMSAGSIFGDV